METGPRRRISTERLDLVAAGVEHASLLAQFFQREREHLEPWSPPFPDDYFTLAGQRRRLRESDLAFRTGSAWKWLFFERERPGALVGTVHYSQIFRGVFCNAMLGYALGREWQGKGFMTEALRATQDEVFSERGRLHRVQANVVPENARSLALLERLGFQHEGLAKQYLFIGGAWRDHVMTAILNPGFQESWR